MSLETLPKFDFVGPHQDPELLSGARNYLETRRVPLPPEIPKTPELEAQLTAMGECIVAYGADLGFDLSMRVTPLDRIHILDDVAMEEFYDMFPNQRGSQGSSLTTGDLVVKQLPPEVMVVFLQNSMHELVHGAAIKDQLLTPANGGWNIEEIRGGFNFMDNAFHGLDEYYTEKIKRKIIARYWPDHPELREFTTPQSTVPEDTPGELTYNAIMDFGALLDQTIASQIGEDALTAMEIAYLTGDSFAFRAVGDGLGMDAVRELANLRTHYPADIKRAAARLGIEIILE